MGDKQKKNAKMAGYLEKRGKMTFTGRWKRWWCVLERHLLLYYKSQTDYSKLSPCCGSLNMALVKSIQPNMGCQIQIRTRTKEKQLQWFHALVSVLPQNDYKIPTLGNFSSALLESYRKSERLKKEKLLNCSRQWENENNEKYKTVSHRNSNIISVSEISRNSAEQLHTTREIHSPFSERQTIKMFEQLKKLYTRNRKSSVYSLKNDLESDTEINFKIRRYSSYHSVINSIPEDDLKTNRRSVSCECVFKSTDKCSLDGRLPKKDHDCETITEANSYSSKCQNAIESNTSRQTLRKRNKKTVISQRTFNFFKKILLKPKPKYSRKEMDKIFVTTQNQIERNDIDINNSHTSVAEPEDDKKNEFINTTTNAIEIIPNEDERNNENGNDSFEKDVYQSWTMIHNGEFSNLTETLPTLPTKKKINSPRYSLRKYEIMLHNENQETDENKPKLEYNTELDDLLMQLTDLNNESNNYSLPDFDIVGEPDYDIPRPHASLIGKTVVENALTDTGGPEGESNDNLCSSGHDRSMSIDMAPDSLEMPWLSNNKAGNFNYWSSINDYHFGLENNIESDNDDIYQDSLNPIKHAT